MIVRNSIKYRKTPPKGGIRFEPNGAPSESVPDQSLTVRELLKRHGRGTLQDIQHQEVYYSEDMPDMRGLDIVQKRQMMEDNMASIHDTQQKETERAKAEKAKKAETKKIVDDATTSDSPDNS